MKRLLIFSLAYYPQVGGAEIALKEITDRIPDPSTTSLRDGYGAGIEFHMLTMNFGGDSSEETIGNVRVYRIGNGASYIQKILFVPRAAAAAARLHRTHRFDAFWAMMSYMLFPIVLLRFAGIRVPYLLTLQEGDPWEHMYRRWFILPFVPLIRAGFRHASAVQVISTYLASWARRMGYRGTPVVIPNGVALERFTAAPAQEPGTTLITTSRLVEKNAVDDIIRALGLLPASVRFVIYGTGPLEGELRALAQRLGVENRTEFRGHLSPEEVPAALASAHIFVRPSRSEGMGNSFIEAMAAGIPVIGTGEGGITDFLFSGETGWVVKKDNPEQIAQAVRDILSHPEAVTRVVANAKALVEEKYDWNLISKRMRALFATIGI